MEKTGLRLSATSWSMDVISPTILYPLFIIETCYQLSRGTAVIKLQALNNFCSALTAMFGAHHQRVIAHPGCATVSLIDAVARALRRSPRTERPLTLAVLTTERKAA